MDSREPYDDPRNWDPRTYAPKRSSRPRIPDQVIINRLDRKTPLHEKIAHWVVTFTWVAIVLYVVGSLIALAVLELLGGGS